MPELASEDLILPALTPTLPSLFAEEPASPPAYPRAKFPRDIAGFQAELKRRVNEYFQRTGKSERGGWLKTSPLPLDRRPNY